MLSSILFLALIGDSQSLTLTGPGATFHGYLGNGSYSLMKHRIGDNSVLNPIEFGLLYKTKYWQFDADYLKDCFGHPAGTLVGGPKIDFLNYFSAGIAIGGYIRKTMIDSGGLPFVYTGHGIDLMPMGGVTLSGTIPVTKRIGIEINTMSNGVVNHGNVGLKIGF